MARRHEPYVPRGVCPRPLQTAGRGHRGAPIRLGVPLKIVGNRPRSRVGPRSAVARRASSSSGRSTPEAAARGRYRSAARWCCPADERTSASPRSKRWPAAVRSSPWVRAGATETVIPGVTGWLVADINRRTPSPSAHATQATVRLRSILRGSPSTPSRFSRRAVRGWRSPALAVRQAMETALAEAHTTGCSLPSSSWPTTRGGRRVRVRRPTSLRFNSGLIPLTKGRCRPLAPLPGVVHPYLPSLAVAAFHLQGLYRAAPRPDARRRLLRRAGRQPARRSLARHRGHAATSTTYHLSDAYKASRRPRNLPRRLGRCFWASRCCFTYRLTRDGARPSPAAAGARASACGAC